MIWQQAYNPMGNMFLSTLCASIPVIVMLVGLGFLHMKAHIAAGLGLPEDLKTLSAASKIVICISSQSSVHSFLKHNA